MRWVVKILYEDQWNHTKYRKEKLIKSKSKSWKMSMQAHEDLEGKYETEETPESILLLVHIPDGSFGLSIALFSIIK